MAEAYKVLGQSNPAATTLTDMYTVPGATQVVASTIVMCNRTNATKQVRVSVAVGGAADGLQQYLFYDFTILKHDTTTATLGLTLSAGDVVRVYTSAVGVSFSLFGTEIT